MQEIHDEGKKFILIYFTLVTDETVDKDDSDSDSELSGERVNFLLFLRGLPLSFGAGKYKINISIQLITKDELIIKYIASQLTRSDIPTEI